jgi:DNA-directed RNA polymerase specialized sigma24 family protein
MTGTDYQALLQRLDPDPARVGEAYERHYQRLTLFFENRGCCRAEDYVDRTLDRFAQKSEKETIQNPGAYLLEVARFVLKESWRESRRERVCFQRYAEYQDQCQEQGLTEDHDLEERRHACLDRCLSGFDSEVREAVLDYYAGQGQEKIQKRKRIREALGISEQALRNRMHRRRTELRACVDACLGSVG